MVRKSGWATRARVFVAVLAVIVVATASGFFGALLAPNLTDAEHDGTIHGCVSWYTGQLRITYTDGQCTSSERPVNWSALIGGSIVDIQTVTGHTVVDDNDPDNRASVSVECPAGYQVVGGGAGLGTISGNNGEKWAMSLSTPVEAGSGVFVNDGWYAVFNTVDGQDSDGYFGFFADAICILTS